MDKLFQVLLGTISNTSDAKIWADTEFGNAFSSDHEHQRVFTSFSKLQHRICIPLIFI